jgi:hypothetical protein
VPLVVSVDPKRLEDAVVLSVSSRASLSLQDRCDLRPLPIVELLANHRGYAVEHAAQAMATFPATPGTGTGTFAGEIRGQALDRA